MDDHGQDGSNVRSTPRKELQQLDQSQIIASTSDICQPTDQQMAVPSAPSPISSPPADAPEVEEPQEQDRLPDSSAQPSGRAADPMDAAYSADNKRKRVVGSSSGQDLLQVAEAAPLQPITRMDITSLHKGSGRGPGLAGLANLGNTCFMNSSLQCLAHTVPLMRAFLTGAYLQDINTTNPLGMKGELAEGFGQLMHLLWKGGVGHVTPRKFKERIGRFAPQFSGYAQHDSQEFIAFLLDGLHEDLNRIKNKPYIEERDNSGRPDPELAAEAWSNYRARNDSTIVDHFQGLYKSRLDCPKCQFMSVKFDPFMYLSLPLPESRMRHLTLTVVCLASTEPPAKVVVEVPNAGTVRDVQAKLWQLLGPSLTPPATWDQQPAGQESPTASPAPQPATGALDAAQFAQEQPPMLCVRLNRGYSSMSDDVEIFPATARVSEIVPSSKFASGEFLVMYVYPPVPARDTLTLDTTDVVVAPVVEQQQQTGQVVQEAQSQQQGDGGGSAAEPLGGLGVEGVQGSGADDAQPMESDEQPAQLGVVTLPAEMQGVFGVPFQPGCSPLVVHHKLLPRTTYGRGSFFMVPLILWVPTHLLPTTLDHPDVQEIPASTHHTFMREYEIVGGSAQLCSRAVHTALRPYRTSDGIAADEAELTASGQLLQDVYDLPELPDEVNREELAEVGGGDDAMQPVDEQGDAGADTVTVAADTGARTVSMETADPVESRGLLGGQQQAIQLSEQEPTLDAQPLPDPTLDGPTVMGTLAEVEQAMKGASGSAAAVQGAAGSGAEAEAQPQYATEQVSWVVDQPPPSSSSPFTNHANEPFNMWAAQEQQQPAMQVSLSGGGVRKGRVTGPGYRLLVSSSHGHHQISNKSKPFQTAKAEGTWHVLCEWAADAGGRWDVASMDTAPVDHPSVHAHDKRKAAGKAPVALDACVEAFLQPEQLSEEDSWYCPRCKEHVQADKKLDLWALPEVLVVHLKRFSYTRYSRDKLDTPVDAPHDLDLSRYVQDHVVKNPDQIPTATTATATTPAGLMPASNGNISSTPMSVDVDAKGVDGSTPERSQVMQDACPAAGSAPCTPRAGPVGFAAGSVASASARHQYQLFGVVNHFGGLGGGHYTAHVKMPGVDQWNVYDDSSVYPLDRAGVVTPAAYLLLYRSTAACQQDPHDLLDQLLAQHQDHLRQEQAKQSPASDDALPGADQDLPFSHNTCTDLALYNTSSSPHRSYTPPKTLRASGDSQVVPDYSTVDFPLPDPGLGMQRRSLDGGGQATGDEPTPNLLKDAAWALHGHQQQHDLNSPSSPSLPAPGSPQRSSRRHAYRHMWQTEAFAQDSGSRLADTAGSGDRGGFSGGFSGAGGFIRSSGGGGSGYEAGEGGDQHVDAGDQMSDGGFELRTRTGGGGGGGSETWSQQTDGDSLEPQQSDLDPEDLQSVGGRSADDLSDMWDPTPTSYPSSPRRSEKSEPVTGALVGAASNGDVQGCSGRLSGVASAGLDGLMSSQEFGAQTGTQPMMMSPVKHVPVAAGQHVLSTSTAPASGGSHMMCDAAE